MQIKELSNRIFQIYALTILVRTAIASIGMSVLSLELSMLFPLFFFGLLITAIFSFPNIIVLYLGLKYIYKNASNSYG
ncbi:MAG: uncharacterized membrane-anchored protein YitT (DUF2179 family) [Maribacter sp.]|jgi:uncharacterized membrane-anchored protein YitT (DUF2179 family)